MWFTTKKACGLPQKIHVVYRKKVCGFPHCFSGFLCLGLLRKNLIVIDEVCMVTYTVKIHNFKFCK
jgi:hypothetical protein